MPKRKGGGGKSGRSRAGGVEAGQTTGREISGAIREIGSKNSDTFLATFDASIFQSGRIVPVETQMRGYKYRIENGTMTFEGANGKTSSVNIGGNTTAQGFMDRDTTRLFRLINRGNVEITRNDNNLVITEIIGRSRSSTRIPLTPPNFQLQG